MPAVLKNQLIYDIQLVAVCQDKSSGIPTFCEDDLCWLLESKISSDTENGLIIGVALSTSMDSRSDVLALCHKRRLLMLKLPESHDDLESTDHPGLNLLDDILLGSSLAGTGSANSLTNSIQLASLTASEVALLLYHSIQAHSNFLDLAILAGNLGYDRIPPHQSFELSRMILKKDKGNAIMSLGPDHFNVKSGKKVLKNTFLRQLIKTTQLALGSYAIACKFAEECGKNVNNGPCLLKQAKIDTRRIPASLVGRIAQFEAVEKALYLAKSKIGPSRLSKKGTSNAENQAGIAYEVTKDGQNIKVTNEQYKYKLAFNTRQHLKISLNDTAGETHTYTAKTLRSAPGKQSTLDFEGKQRNAAMELLRNSTASSPNGAVTIKSVEVYGREDHTAADTQGMRWRRQLLCCSEEGGKFLNATSDPSQLLIPFLLGEKHQRVTKLVDKHTIRLMERPKAANYGAIAARERNNKLNPSQAKAARAILSPLTSSLSTVTSSEDIWQQEDRFVLVHGPPGTGKTSLITACCEQWEKSCSNMENEDEKARDTIYAVCQSNVAVKNIAESFVKAGINFKIIVSAQFFVEWHEDLYDDIMPYFLRADQLAESREHLSKNLEGCNVILSTLSFLSSAKMAEGSTLFKLRPMRLLFVDEASQIHLRAYPHLFRRYGPKVGRIVFLGDYHQLPPYQGDTVVDAGLSVFELEHLRRKAFLLDTCYRLAVPMVTFISNNVYSGQILCGAKNYNPKGAFQDCVSFIDVESSKEEKEGTSRMNREEIKMVTKLVAEYKQRGGSMKELKVLTPYIAQKEALEKALKTANLSGAGDIVFTIDSFQGRECEYIILSLVKDGRFVGPEVRHKGGKLQRQGIRINDPALGFLNDDRRLNVALTRAKKGIVVVSNRKLVRLASKTLIGKLHAELQRRIKGEAYWWSHIDVLNNQLPRALFGPLSETQGLASEMAALKI